MKEVLCSTTHSRNHEKIALKDDFLLILSLRSFSWTLQKCTNLHTLLDMKTELCREKNKCIKCSFDFSSYPTIFGLKRHVLNCNLLVLLLVCFSELNIMFHCKSFCNSIQVYFFDVKHNKNVYLTLLKFCTYLYR